MMNLRKNVWMPLHPSLLFPLVAFFRQPLHQSFFSGKKSGHLRFDFGPRLFFLRAGSILQAPWPR